MITQCPSNSHSHNSSSNFFQFSMANLDKFSTCNDASTQTKEALNRESKVHFSEDEKTLITRMHNLVGERWSLIAGRIPGRSAEEIQKYWTSKYSTNN